MHDVRRPMGFVLLVGLVATACTSPRKPNIVLIMADDLGYGELGCYGQTKIQTPHIDQLAADGMRFTQFYSGAAVCAPSRSCLMTGLHTGHTPVRTNGGGMPILPEDVTVGEVLQSAGYTTGCFGKWGLGVAGTTGHPNRQGFDTFFGFLHQVHAHFYYPYFMWQNETRYPLPENEGRQRVRYAHDEIHTQALDFIRHNKDHPFFCYVPYTIPHVELVVPAESKAPYLGKCPEEPLPDPRAGYIGADDPYATFAGMVSRMDAHVGQIVALLDELDLADNTVVIFMSDNGAQGGAWRRMTDFFDGNGPLRAYKGQFYEGGIRVPLVVRWPGRVAAGAVSDHIGAFWDFLPTLAELGDATPPEGLDGISFVPTMLGSGEQERHEFLYWEFTSRRGRMQAVRMDDWKFVQPRATAPPELYNLKSDISETTNVADRHPEIVARIRAYLATARTEGRTYAPDSEPRRISDYVR